MSGREDGRLIIWVLIQGGNFEVNKFICMLMFLLYMLLLESIAAGGTAQGVTEGKIEGWDLSGSLATWSVCRAPASWPPALLELVFCWGLGGVLNEVLERGKNSNCYLITGPRTL